MDRRWSRLAATAAVVGLAMTGLPPAFSPHGIGAGHALAAGNGHGGGNGGGNGNGGGHAGGNGNGHAGGNSSGNGGGDGNGNAGPGNAHADADAASGGGASGLGALNAAHASPSALANASPNSRVGKVEAYKDALDRYLCDLAAGTGDLAADITAMADALAAASNKQPTTESLNGLDGLLGEDPASVDPNWDSTTAPAVVDQARAEP